MPINHCLVAQPERPPQPPQNQECFQVLHSPAQGPVARQPQQMPLATTGLGTNPELGQHSSYQRAMHHKQSVHQQPPLPTTAVRYTQPSTQLALRAGTGRAALHCDNTRCNKVPCSCHLLPWVVMLGCNAVPSCRVLGKKTCKTLTQLKRQANQSKTGKSVTWQAWQV